MLACPTLVIVRNKLRRADDDSPAHVGPRELSAAEQHEAAGKVSLGRDSC